MSDNLNTNYYAFLFDFEMMKRILLLVVTLYLYGSVCCMADPPVLDKALEKECRQFTRQLQKEGWHVWDLSEPLVTAVRNYFGIIGSSDEDMLSVVGYGESKHPATAHKKAVMNAKTQHASSKGTIVNSHFAGTEQTDMSGSDSQTQVLGMQSSTIGKIKLPDPSLSIFRTRDDGITEVRIYYLIEVQ